LEHLEFSQFFANEHKLQPTSPSSHRDPPIPGRSWCLQHHLSVGRIFRVKATWDGFQASRITECIERSFQLFQLGGIFTPEELIDPVTQDTGAAFDRWHCIVVVCPVSQPCGDASDLNTKWVTNTFTDSHTGYSAHGLVVVLFYGAFTKANGHEVVGQPHCLASSMLRIGHTKSAWTITGQIRHGGHVATGPCAFSYATFAV